jgi:hypothetical protein
VSARQVLLRITGNCNYIVIENDRYLSRPKNNKSGKPNNPTVTKNDANPYVQIVVTFAVVFLSLSKYANGIARQR